MVEQRHAQLAPQLSTEVLIIGAGGAGMYAAITAAQAGAQVLLLDRSLIGRGGATIMAQMTVAAAVGPEGSDHWRHHLQDTLAAGRGLTDARLARMVCEDGVECIRQMDAWKVGWARDGEAFRAVQAPGHDRARCVYVDFLNTGPAVSKTLRTQLQRYETIRRLGDVLVTDVVMEEGRAVGVVAVDLTTGKALSIAAKAVIIATGGLTRLYARNSASSNMGGDGYALALRAGATLTDMEFVQFFPIGNLAPRLVGMDPIMWDPFRYKLGGKLLNALGEDFLPRYGNQDGGRYTTTRDQATYAITKEVEAGRGSPHGGAFLSFQHVPAETLRAAFGPVIDRLAKNGIDLTQTAIEVAPIAHYHMGGVRVGTDMATGVRGLFAAGEAVGGAAGANRLSGNAITECFVFGQAAGRSAVALAAATPAQPWQGQGAEAALALVAAEGPTQNTAAMIAALQRLMAGKVGPFRTAAGLEEAQAGLAALRAGLGETPPGVPKPYDMARMDWFDLRQMLLVAECVTLAAMARRESRGAHQREDFPQMMPGWDCNQHITLAEGQLALQRAAVAEAA